MLTYHCRLYVIKHIPSLRKLDNADVTNEERIQSLSVEIDNDFDVNSAGADEDAKFSNPSQTPSVMVPNYTLTTCRDTPMLLRLTQLTATAPTASLTTTITCG